MKKHILQENYERMFGSIKEDWWDDMSPEDQASYIKDHPGSKQAQSAKDTDGDEDDYDMGVVPGSRELDDTPEDDSEKGSSLTSAPGRVPDEDDEDDKGGDDKPDSEEPEPEYSGDETYPDGDGPPDTSGAGEGSSQEELDDALEFQREYQSHLDKWAEEAAENDDDETLAKIQELDDENKKEQERLEQSGAKSMYRTGNELNQETLTIDGKQFRRISEGVEKQPKPKYAFSEFYQRFKK